LVVDGGTENVKEVITLLNSHGIGRIQISPYNSRANGTIERGHRTILAALSKSTDGGTLRWLDHLPAVLLAERITTHRPTGVDPFSLVYGRECILPVESQFPTWRILDWTSVENRGDLLALRARQLEMRGEDLKEALARKKRIREEGKDAFDATHNVRHDPLKEGDVVLRYDKVVNDTDMSLRTKLNFRWLGPYRIHSVNPVGSFKLAEMDGVVLQKSFTGSQLKRFVLKNRFFVPDHATEEEQEHPLRETAATLPAKAPYPPSLDLRHTRSMGHPEQRSDSESEDDTAPPMPPPRTIQKRNSAGIVVRVPELSEAKRAQYLRFDDLESPSD
jgi:hypothetical protein